LSGKAMIALVVVSLGLIFRVVSWKKRFLIL
jgi:hypothetical protein